MQDLRVAFFPCTYNEVDGVANTSRQFEAFAERRGLPLLIVCAGTKDSKEWHGSVLRITRSRGRLGFPLDEQHEFDLMFWRHYVQIANELRDFAPDFLHITGPSDVGQLGALLADQLQIPLAASWHTNLHEYAEQRGSTLFGFIPEPLRRPIGAQIRQNSLQAILRFYRIPQMLFAPNPELMDLLLEATGKPVYPMHRGVDVNLFAPERRNRADSEFVIGYVGRLNVEKNIRVLAEIERALLRSGFLNFRLLIVGQGAEERWLRDNMRRAELAGVLKAEALASAYANMDVFAFPSRTDTFGNVVLEALACGVPAIVTDRGGPQFIVRHGETGFIVPAPCEFAQHIRYLAENPARLRMMREAARADACRASWDSIFEGVYAAYERGLRGGFTGKRVRPRWRPVATSPAVS